MVKIAFNTASLVARCGGHQYKFEDWGLWSDRTVAATNEAHWEGICEDVSAAGYRGIEVWEAHASPNTMTEARARNWQDIMARHGLEPVAFGGMPTRQNAEICNWLGISVMNSGLWGVFVEEAEMVCQEFGLKFNFENHAEMTAAEILERTHGGSEAIGVCLDTGWCGTNGVSAVEMTRELGSLIRHVHVKDVAGFGKHQTALPGTGVVGLESALNAIRETGYDGWYSWEDQAEDRNPMSTAAANREWIADRVRHAPHSSAEKYATESN